MSEVTGPISTLPGTRHHLPSGTPCDLHPDRPAVARIQGETDSFGSELNDMCQGCLEEYRRQMREVRDRLETCEWCKAENVKVREQRDYEEGLHGRVYRVCADCIKRQNDAAEEYLERHGYYDDYDYDD